MLNLKKVLLSVVLCLVVISFIGCSNNKPIVEDDTSVNEETMNVEDNTLNENNSEQIIFALAEKIPFAGENLENYGIASEIATEAFKIHGLECKFEFYPAQRAEQEIIDGSAWGSFPVKKTPEREKNYLFTEPVIYSATEFFYNKDKVDGSKVVYDKLEELKGYTIVGIKGYFYEAALNNAGLNVEYVTTEEEAIRMLESGRVDFFISPDAGGIYNIRKFFPEQEEKFKVLSKPFDPKSPFYVMVSKDYPNSEDLIELFNDGLAKLKESGKYAEILGKYGLSE